MALKLSWATPLPDGVYLNLPERDYFAQEALGSTDLIRLYFKKWGWWWASAYNTEFVDKDTPARTAGSALHAILLEGIAAYEARYVPEPDPRTFPGLIDTKEDLERRLRDEGFSIPPHFKVKQHFLDAMRASLPDVPVWSNILEDFNDNVQAGRKVVTALEDRQLRFMREVAIVERDDNADVRQLFDDSHPTLTEVSVFWTDERGIRRRARFDSLLPAFTLDLKSLDNYNGQSLRFFTGELIAKRGYDIQRADHFEARQQAMRLIGDGRLFGGSPEQRRWIATFPDQSPDGDYVWLFYQKPDPVVGHAPILFPVYDHSWQWNEDTRQNEPTELRAAGEAKRIKALEFYLGAVRKYGLDQPWARVEDVHYTNEGYEPRVFLPPWSADVDEHHGAAFEEDEREPV